MISLHMARSDSSLTHSSPPSASRAICTLDRLAARAEEVCEISSLKNEIALTYGVFERYVLVVAVAATYLSVLWRQKTVSILILIMVYHRSTVPHTGI